MSASAIAILVGVPLGLSVVLFYVFRVFVPREVKETSPNLGARDFVEATLIIVGLLTLLGLATFGYIWAAVVFAIVMGLAKLLAVKAIAAADGKSEDD